jgi:hypothetical protein
VAANSGHAAARVSRGSLEIGSRIRRGYRSTDGDGLPELDGVVDWRSRDFLGVRTEGGMYRFLHISVFGGPIGVAHHIFVDGLDQTETEDAWEEWLTKVFTS